MLQPIQLQQLLGTDKRNPSFTICRDDEAGCLHVYYGADLFEKVPEDRNDPQYKMMVARLYNAGVNAVKLKAAFGADRKTMQRWGDALKSGDPETLVRVLAGRQGSRKLTPEICAFVRIRFRVIYTENPSSYSKQMRAEIAEVYGEELCSETLRALLKELKEQIHRNPAKEDEKRETDCECVLESKSVHDEQNQVIEPERSQRYVMEGSDLPQGSPVSGVPSDCCVHFIHHLGVLLFSAVLLKVEALMGPMGWLAKQWLATLFLGAVNIEQSKLLDFDGFEALFGKTLRSRRPQRVYLGALACTEAAEELLVLNAEAVSVRSYNDFYYDPHTKHCSTRLKVLKGWCGSKHFADKALHMDFIHTSAGHPVYVAYGDNYEDLRERFGKTVEEFRVLVGMDDPRVLSFVLDRGIFGRDLFGQVMEDPHIHIVTWEKGYQRGEWDQREVKGRFVMQRCRNRLEDIKKYSFEYMDERWEKDPRMRSVRVRATNPKGRTIELGILTDDRERPAEELIRLMFRRWLQENDFKYLEKHFGINQITSYAWVSYKDLKHQVEDKQMKSGEYKALQKERQMLRADLKRLLFHEHQHPGKSLSRQKKIKELSLQDESLTQRIGQTQQEVSRLEHLIEENYQRLDVSSKKVMDALKLIARNAFYEALVPFKEKYNNYRDDHVIFRNLTHAHGVMIRSETQVEVQLFPTAHYPPALRRIIENLFEQINAQGLRMPDGSERLINFRLGEKAGIELANTTSTFTPNY